MASIPNATFGRALEQALWMDLIEFTGKQRTQQIVNHPGYPTIRAAVGACYVQYVAGGRTGPHPRDLLREALTREPGPDGRRIGKSIQKLAAAGYGAAAPGAVNDPWVQHSRPAPTAPAGPEPGFAGRSYADWARLVLDNRAEEALADDAWGALQALMRRADREGRDPIEMLAAAARKGLDDARSVPALLAWRIRRELDARPPTNGTAQGTASAAPGRARGGDASADPPQATPPPAKVDPEPPNWTQRPFGASSDEELTDLLNRHRGSGMKLATAAREAQEKADTAMDLARARRGPAVRTVTQRWERLHEAGPAIEELQRSQQDYTELFEAETAARRDLGELRERLAARRLGGRIPAIMGTERRQLEARAGELERQIQDTPAQLSDLDAGRPRLERLAGPVEDRVNIHQEWTRLQRQSPQSLAAEEDTARQCDIEDAANALACAGRLYERAETDATRYDELVSEIAVREHLTPEQAHAEDTGRRAAADVTEVEIDAEDELTEEAEQELEDNAAVPSAQAYSI